MTSAERDAVAATGGEDLTRRVGVQDLAHAWRRQGARITSERLDLLEVLLGAGEPLTAIQVVGLLVEQRGRSLDLSTVHRSLRGLHASGLVYRVATGGEQGKVSSAYRLHHTRGFTARCTQCENVIDLPPAATRWARSVAKATGFRISPGSPSLVGQCASCVAAPLQER